MAADLHQALKRVLREGPRTSAELSVALGVSQPTLSRTIQSYPQSITSFRVRGDRTPRYALLRALPAGLESRQKVYRVTRSGTFTPFADLEFLSNGSTLERVAGPNGRATLYDGLPPYMNFAAPSGFLGRQLARELALAQGFPQSLSDWRDEHRIAYLFTRGLNLPGNLVFGNISLQLEMDLLQARSVPDAEKLPAYVEMASALKSAVYGSSAGGEQPKFLWLTETGHVIVKFAKLGSRMAELLPLEHLALRALAEVGVPASRTQLLTADDYVFLEVERFDRVGLNGRVGLLSAGAIDDEFFGRRDSWPEFAARCETARMLSSQDARHVDTMAAFSELIGNGDRHFENISLLIDEEGDYQGIAPAYDILPMRYASIGGGVDPDLTPIQPKVGPIGANPEVWGRAARAANSFWLAAQTEKLAAPISDAMRRLAAENQIAVGRFVAPLVPGD